MASKPRKTPPSDDSPPLTMRVEQGRLVCLSAWDQERLDTYSLRPVVYVSIVAPQSPLRVKFEAILNTAARQCQTPWTNVQAARKTIKQMLGVVEPVMVDGTLIADYPASLKTLSEPEFEDFYKGAMAMLHAITGVDPETLWKNSPDVADIRETSGADGFLPSSSDQAGDASPQLPSPADQDAQEPVDKRTRSLMSECLDKFLRAATDTQLLPDPKDRQETLVLYKETWKAALPDNHAFVAACLKWSNDVILGKVKKIEAEKVLSGMLP